MKKMYMNNRQMKNPPCTLTQSTFRSDGARHTGCRNVNKLNAPNSYTKLFA